MQSFICCIDTVSCSSVDDPKAKLIYPSLANLDVNNLDSYIASFTGKSSHTAVSTASSAAGTIPGIDGILTERLAETFLSRFLDTKRIEDFVKSVPAGQESLQITAVKPVKTLSGTKSWKVRPGEKEEVLVGLRNQSKTNNSLILFGILSNVTDPKNIKEVYKKNKAMTYSLEILPGHEATILYPLTLQGAFEERVVSLDIIFHYMDKGSKLFGKVSAKPLQIELLSVSSYWMDYQLIVIVAVSAAFLTFFAWLVLQAVFKGGRKHKRRHSE